jgi:hypothetical protein
VITVEQPPISSATPSGPTAAPKIDTVNAHRTAQNGAGTQLLWVINQADVRLTRDASASVVTKDRIEVPRPVFSVSRYSAVAAHKAK